MSKESRLCYHAVPRILKTDIAWINESINENDDSECTESDVNITTNANCSKKRRLTSKSDDNDYNDDFQGSLWNDVTMDSGQWKPFSDYISDCRINVNVRQVLNHGEQTLN